MKQKRKQNTTIVLIIVVILLLSVVCIIFAVDIHYNKPQSIQNSNQNSNSTITNSNENPYVEYEGLAKFIVDEHMSDCVSTRGFYSYDRGYVILVNNFIIKDKQYNIKFVANNGSKDIFLNNKLIENIETIKNDLLTSVCSYGNYILYSTGWEGWPNYRIVDTNGKIIMSFTAQKVEYVNNYLNIEEVQYKENDNTLLKYKLDMTQDQLEKINLTTEKYICDVYDC